MNAHQKGKNIPQQSGGGNQAPNSYPNQRSNNSPYHPFEGDAQQRYTGYGGAHIGGAGTAGAPPRLPLVTGHPGAPNPPLGGTPNVAGVIPPGPPPGSFVGHGAGSGGLDLSKQTPPHHQQTHHPASLPPGSLGVNQQIAMASAGHAGPGMQGRPTQGNYQFNNRSPNIRPGSQHMPGRPPMNPSGAAINPSHPPTPQAIPYPNQPLSMNQPVLFVIGGDQFNSQPQLFSYPNHQAYFPGAGNMPPGQFQPRAPQQPFGYRPSPPYNAYSMPSTTALYYPQQQQPQQQQPQQAQQQQQVQQVQPQQQQQQALPVVPQNVVVPSQVPITSAQSQPSRDTGSGKKRTSAIRIVDPNTNRDVLTGEEVPPPIPAPAAASEAATTPAASPALSAAAATSVSSSVIPEEEAAPAEGVVPPATSAEAAPVVEPALAAETSPAVDEKKKEETVSAAVETAPAGETSAASEEAASVAQTVTPSVPAHENGQPAVVAAANVTSESPCSSASPTTSSPHTPAPTCVSPDPVEGRGNPKKNKRKNSRSGLAPTPTPPPITPEESTAKPVQPAVESEPQSVPSAEEKESVGRTSPANVPVKDVAKPEPEAKREPSQPAAVETKEVAEKPAALATVTEVPPADVVPIESVITNGDKQVSSPSSSVIESTPPSTVTEDGETRGPGKVLRYTYKDDQWSPVNPEGKKTYDRNFLLELQNNPASQKKPEGLPSLEVVRDKGATTMIKRGVMMGGGDFTPPFLKMTPGKPQGPPGKRSQQGMRGDQGMGGQGPGSQPRREIKLPSMSTVQKERVDDPNVWKPKHASKAKDESPEKAAVEALMKAVRGILNKLTPSKFEQLLTKIQGMSIDTEERLAGVIKLFFEKAVDEPIFSSLYAKMCHALSMREVASASNPSETTNFRKLLLTRCQREFEKDSAGLQDVENKKKEIEENQVEEKKKELEDELEDLVNKNRRRSLGNIRFIGELFKLRVLSAKIMHQCIHRLLSQPEDEESLECLCRLLSTIGKELEHTPGATKQSSTSNREIMNSYFSSMEGIVNKKKISNRIRFMIQDVVDLRKNQWKPRREDNNPKTIDQIHKEAIREREEQERELSNPQNFQGSMGSMSGQPGRDNRMGGDRRGGDRGDGRKPSRPGDDGWSMVSGGSRGSSGGKLDMKQLRIPKAPGDADQGISLGPGGRGMGSWGRGASGGMSQSMIGSGSGSTVAPQDTRSNRYQILEDDSASHVSHDRAAFTGRSSLGGPPQSGGGGRGGQDYRNVSGSNKGAFYSQKDGERDRGFESSRPQNFGPGGRSRSQQSSRENSVTRPPRESPQLPPQLAREPSKELLLGKPDVSDDEIERKATVVLGEFFTNDSIENAVLDMKEWLHPTTVSKFINQCLMHVLEHNRKERRATGLLFKEMVKRRFFSSKDILNGFDEVMQSAEDFIVDIPKLWEYLAEVVAPFFEEGVINLSFLGQLSSSLKQSLASNFVAATLKELVNAQGVAGAERIWITSNAPLGSLLPDGVDVHAFVSQHKELDFLLKSDCAPRSSGGGKSGSASVYLEFQRNLEQHLRGKNLPTEEVCSWIQKQNLGEPDTTFIRALVTAVTESCIDGHGTDSKLNSADLKHYSEVLRRYVENMAERELQLLFAVQTLVTQKQHPKGLIQGIFETLYDSNVVSEEGFESWVQTDDPLEREGKAVALKSITSFLTWLKEADPESDQEVEG